MCTISKRSISFCLACATDFRIRSPRDKNIKMLRRQYRKHKSKKYQGPGGSRPCSLQREVVPSTLRFWPGNSLDGTARLTACVLLLLTLLLTSRALKSSTPASPVALFYSPNNVAFRARSEFRRNERWLRDSYFKLSKVFTCALCVELGEAGRPSHRI